RPDGAPAQTPADTAVVVSPDVAPAVEAAPAPVGSLGQIGVSAGELERQNTIVSFPLPGGAGPLALRDGQGATLPLQVDDGKAVFVLPALKAGAEATFSITRAP